MRSAAQKLASRVNGAKSKGPNDTSRTRYNGVTHGLCSVNPTLPGEDPAGFQAENKGWFDDWQPLTHTRAVLVARAASLSWRLRRAVEAEADTRARDAERAGRDFDYEQAARVGRAATPFDDDPMAALTLLESHAAGLDRLLVSWSGLEAALESGPDGWDQELYHKRLLILQGRLRRPAAGRLLRAARCSALVAAAAPLPRTRPQPAAAGRGAAEAAETLRPGRGPGGRPGPRAATSAPRPGDRERPGRCGRPVRTRRRSPRLRHRARWRRIGRCGAPSANSRGSERPACDLGEPEPPPEEAPPPEPAAGQPSDVTTEVSANKDVNVPVPASLGSVGADDFVPGSDRPESPSRPSRPRIRPSDGAGIDPGPVRLPEIENRGWEWSISRRPSRVGPPPIAPGRGTLSASRLHMNWGSMMGGV